jgi:hypothetical protein
MEDLSIPQELLDEAGEGFGKRNLTVPKEAEQKRKKGWTRFVEHVVVEDAFREVKDTDSGHKHTVFTLATRVLAREGTVNTGKPLFVWPRINYASLADPDPDRKNGQKIMSMGSIRRLKSLVIASGVDLQDSGGLSGELLNVYFPLKDSFDVEGGDVVRSPLVEKRFIVSISDNANSQWNDENRQEVESFQMITEE